MDSRNPPSHPCMTCLLFITAVLLYYENYKNKGGIQGISYLIQPPQRNGHFDIDLRFFVQIFLSPSVGKFYYIYKVPNGRIRTKICVIPSLNNLIPIHEKYQMLGLIPMWQTNAGGHLRIHYRISWGPLTALLLFFFLLVMMIVFHHEEYKIGNYGWSALMESYLSRDCVDKFGQGPKSHNYNYLSVALKKRIMNMVTIWWQ